MIAAAVVEIIRLQVVADHNLQNVDPTADGSPTVPMVRRCSALGLESACMRRARPSLPLLWLMLLLLRWKRRPVF